MIASALATLLLALAAMLPGPLLVRGKALDIGGLAALATVSLVSTMLATALLGIALHAATGASLPAWALLPVSLALTALALWRTRGEPWIAPRIEWPALALAALFVAYGAICEAFAVREEPSGALLIHAWYNADWFKHLGHVAALADFGVPARDAFNSGAPLHYYWLCYILPGAGAALGGDNWVALDTANAVITVLFSLTLYGAVRLSGAGPRATLAVAFVCLFVCAPLKIANHMLTDPSGLYGLLNGPGAPSGPILASLAQYLPQHSLTLAVFLAWVVLARPGNDLPRAARLLTLAALASAMTLSTLLGAMVLGAYGLISLWNRRLAAVPELAVMAVLSGLLVLALSVIQFGDPTSAIASPLFDNIPDQRDLLTRVFASTMQSIGHVGLPLLAAILLLRFWPLGDTATQYPRRVAIVLLLVALGAAFAAEIVFTTRLAIEARLRLVNLAAIAVAIIGGWAVARYWPMGARQRWLALALGAAMLAAAGPAIYARTVWHWQLGDNFTTEIPRDDRLVLATLRTASDPRAIVWQFPEPPLLAIPPGGDAWATVIGGRAVTGSLRATDYPSAAPRIALAKAFFAGEAVLVPAEVSWIYLSRALHPQSYDELEARLSADAGWRKRACYADACLFSRVAAK